MPTEPYPGVSQLAHYSNMPVGGRRELSPEEEARLAEGRSRWLPKLFPSYSTPPHEMMASPLKQGLLWGLPAAALGALVGGAVGSPAGPGGATAGALVGGLGMGGITGLAAGMGRRAANEDIEELVRRSPPGATRRDLLSDPQYSADQTERARARAQMLAALIHGD